jgi:hypothetical protein
MKIVTREEADVLLACVGMKIGDWNKPVYADEMRSRTTRWFNHPAPTDAHELYLFSLFISEWLTNGQWKMLQFDDSNQFSFNEATILSIVGLGFDEVLDLNSGKNSSFLVLPERESEVRDRIRVAWLLYLLLLFKAHAYLISSSGSGDHLGIHDGRIYFIASDEGLTNARGLLSNFENRQSNWPSWLIDTEINWQEHALRGDRSLH